MAGFSGGPDWRDGVITAAPPRMTAENPTNTEPAAFEGAVGLDGSEKIVGAGRGKPASGGGARGGFEHRIENPLVEADSDADDGGDGF